MPHAPHLKLGSRAAANLTRGLGGSLPLALLPPLLAHRLGKDDFTVWVLVVQIASYVAYLEFGVQTAVSRMVAFRSAERGRDAVAGPMAAGLRLLGLTGLAGCALVAVFTVFLPNIIPIPPGLSGEARVALVVLGGTAALALPGSSMHGALLGAGHNWSSASVIVLCRFSSVSLTLFGAYQGWSVQTLAACLASGSVLNAVAPFIASRIAGLPSPWHRPTRADSQELFGLTLTVGTWTVAALLISGIDVFLVGVVDYAKVSPYGLAAGLVIAASAAYSILFSVLLPAFADLSARRDSARATALLGRSTSLSSAALLSGLLVALAGREWLIDRWAGRYSHAAQPIFVILMITAVIRLSLAPLSTYVMGFGQHRLTRIPAAAESILNLLLSITLGYAIGANGVAIGSLIATGVALTLYLGRVGPRTVGAPFRPLMIRAYLVPAIAAAPFVACILLVPGLPARSGLAVIGVCIQLGLDRMGRRHGMIDNEKVLASSLEIHDMTTQGEIEA